MPFNVVHEFYRLSFNRAQEMREKAEQEAAEREREEVEARDKQNRSQRQTRAAYNNMKQTPPTSPSLPMLGDDLEEILEEVT